MTQLIRMGALAAALWTPAIGAANAQRAGRGGVGSVPRLTTAPPAAPRTTPTLPGGRGIATVPGVGRERPRPRPGDLPRIATGGRSGYGRTFGQPRPAARRSRIWQAPYTRWGVGAGCGFGCVRPGGIVRGGRFTHGFFVGFPFAYPVFVPYAYDASDTGYAAYEPNESPAAAYGEPRGGAKVIVVGTGNAGGDALTVETVADSVRLTWLGSTRPAREVRLFVSDSAQRPLATRSASPAQPTATFEVSTLSAPVAFAGVTVVFADGVVSTTMVPYRDGGAAGRPR